MDRDHDGAAPRTGSFRAVVAVRGFTRRDSRFERPAVLAGLFVDRLIHFDTAGSKMPSSASNSSTCTHLVFRDGVAADCDACRLAGVVELDGGRLAGGHGRGVHMQLADARHLAVDGGERRSLFGERRLDHQARHVLDAAQRCGVAAMLPVDHGERIADLGDDDGCELAPVEMPGDVIDVAQPDLEDVALIAVVDPQRSERDPCHPRVLAKNRFRLDRRQAGGINRAQAFGLQILVLAATLAHDGLWRRSRCNLSDRSELLRRGRDRLACRTVYRALSECASGVEHGTAKVRFHLGARWSATLIAQPIFFAAPFVDCHGAMPLRF
jgi:hypothetical protein